jgi:hypothetical protein
VSSFLAYGHIVSTDKIKGHFIWDVDPSMCNPSCTCDELTDLDLECDIMQQMHRQARQKKSKQAKTPCGLQIYYPHDDKDGYPKFLPVPTPVPVLTQRLAPPWKPKERSLPIF